MSRVSEAVRASIADATAKRADWSLPPDQKADTPRVFEGLDQPIARGEWPGYPHDRLPPGCPVNVLGLNGMTLYLTDTSGQLIALTAAEISKKSLSHLFAGAGYYLEWAWPRWAAKGGVTRGVDVDDAHQCLLNAARRRGVFDPASKVRGRGGWRDDYGAFIWHAGDTLCTLDRSGRKMQLLRTGRRDGHFYERRENVITPWPEPVGPDNSPAGALMADLSTWRMQRETVDPLFVLGWIACAFMGAALKERPHVLLTGGFGVGKTTLQNLVQAHMGDVMHRTGNTTAAGLYQRFGNDCLPVQLDEFEAAADPRKGQAIVELARVAFSGDDMFRGGADHKGVSFQVRAAFIMSGIQPPPLGDQDKSRVAEVSLSRLDANAVMKAGRVVDAETAGRKILRQVMDGFAGFDALREDWREALRSAGLTARNQDTYGTLLAGAQMLLGAEGLGQWNVDVTEPQRVGALVAEATAQDRAETRDNWEKCLDKLFDFVIDAWREGERPTIGTALEAWMRADNETVPGEAIDKARKQLALVGLGGREEWFFVSDKGRRCRRFLMVPVGAESSVAKIYAGTVWANGGWAGALKQAPKDVVLRGAVTFAGEDAPRKNFCTVKINQRAVLCLAVDLLALEEFQARGETP
jgi:hypothetical protein